jgi:hypothetical protein
VATPQILTVTSKEYVKACPTANLQNVLANSPTVICRYFNFYSAITREATVAPHGPAKDRY